jgi:hypothetical protein
MFRRVLLVLVLALALALALALVLDGYSCSSCQISLICARASNNYSPSSATLPGAGTSHLARESLSAGSRR